MNRNETIVKHLISINYIYIIALSFKHIILISLHYLIHCLSTKQFSLTYRNDTRRYLIILCK